MEYQAAVAEARTLVKRSEEDQWRLAQLTWEQVQGGTTKVQWAQDIGVHRTTPGKWCRIWERWGGVDHDARPSWAEAWDWVLGRDERAEAAVLPSERKFGKTQTVQRLADDLGRVERDLQFLLDEASGAIPLFNH